MQMGDARHHLVELIDGRRGQIHGVVLARIEQDLEMSIRSVRSGRQQTGLAVAVPEIARVSFGILARLGAQIGLENEIIIARPTKSRSHERRRIDRRTNAVIVAKNGRIDGVAV